MSLTVTMIQSQIFFFSLSVSFFLLTFSFFQDIDITMAIGDPYSWKIHKTCLSFTLSLSLSNLLHHVISQLEKTTEWIAFKKQNQRSTTKIGTVDHRWQHQAGLSRLVLQSKRHHCSALRKKTHWKIEVLNFKYSKYFDILLCLHTI